SAEPGAATSKWAVKVQVMRVTTMSQLGSTLIGMPRNRNRCQRVLNMRYLLQGGKRRKGHFNKWGNYRARRDTLSWSPAFRRFSAENRLKAGLQPGMTPGLLRSYMISAKDLEGKGD